MLELQEQGNGRLFPMALLPWWDVEASVAEAERAAAMGLRGVNMTSDPQQGGAPDLADRAWDPLWEVCTDAGLPVNFHIGASETSLSWFGNSPWPSQADDQKLAIGSAMMYLTNARVIANLIFSGLLERHPDIRFVSVESGIGWIPFILEALTHQQGELPAAARWTTCRCSPPGVFPAQHVRLLLVRAARRRPHARRCSAPTTSCSRPTSRIRRAFTRTAWPLRLQVSTR